MRVAAYARVSTTRQAQALGIEQQLDRLRAVAAERGWDLEDQHVYRDDGYSGARIGRPGLDRLRDHAALAELDIVLVTAPDRLARNYVHQVLLIDELAARGCQVEFLDRPMSADPHDQLLLQIRGAVAEYERTLIAERMRRGRQAKLRAGTLLPWTTAPFGYRLDPERPRRADAVRVEPGEAALVAELFDWYLEPQATIYRLARRLTDLGVPAPRGGPRWNTASVRGILRNPAYAGRALSNRTQVAPARGRKSAMLPAGPGVSHAPRPPQDWIAVPVPPVVSEQTFAQVQAKLDANQQGAARNTRHEYLLRTLISCGACRLGCTGRQTAAGYRYYLCRGRTDPLRAAQGQRCTARYIPAGQLDELVWADLCALLTDPAQVTRALARAQGGAWLPQELQARQATIGQALSQLERQQQRLLDAYLAEVIALAELDRKRQDLDRRRGTLLAQQRQLDAAARQKLELGAVADGIEAFCQTVRAGLATATFAQRRLLAELLIDRVVVTDGQVEIRYVLPTSPDGPHRPFCQLCKDHLDAPAGHRDGDQPRQRDRLGCPAPVERQRSGVAVAPGQQDAVPVPVLVGGIVAGHLQHRPVVVTGALRPGPGSHPVPGADGNHAGGRCGRRDRAARADRKGVVGADRQHITHPALADAAAQLTAAVYFIAGHEGGADPQAVRAVQQGAGQLRLGGEHHLLRDAGQLAVLLISRAPFGQVQSPADQRMPAAGGIGQGDRHLAQRDTAHGAAVLPRRADGNRQRTSHRPSHPRSAPHPRHQGDRPPTPTRCPPRAARPRPHATANAAAGAARDARSPRRSSSSCDRPVPSAARKASGRRTAGSPAGESTRPPVPAGPPAARTGHHRLLCQQRLPHLDRVSQTHHDRGSRTCRGSPAWWRDMVLAASGPVGEPMAQPRGFRAER
jgi:site-specific DNA recombinase